MKVLFICTHNRCRSILCEAIANQQGQGLLVAKSAGSSPAGEVHPATLAALTEQGYATAGLTSQSWDDFADFNPDVVITVCDQAAGEACPLWLGDSLKIHQGLTDPSKLDGSARSQAFDSVIADIESGIAQLVSIAKQQLTDETRLQALQGVRFTAN